MSRDFADDLEDKLFYLAHRFTDAVNVNDWKRWIVRFRSRKVMAELIPISPPTDMHPRRHFINNLARKIGGIFLLFLLLNALSSEFVRFEYQNTSPIRKAIWVHVHKYQEGWIDRNPFRDCAEKCALTTKRVTSFNQSNYVLFIGPITGDIEPPVKLPGQTWIFFTQEPPFNHGMDFRKWRRLFNWTMTYRRDSDVFIPYGMFEVRSKNASSLYNKGNTDVLETYTKPVSNDSRALKEKHKMKYLEHEIRRAPSQKLRLLKRGNMKLHGEKYYSKTKVGLAWQVSHCNVPSQRTEAVQEMAKDSRFVLTIQGLCGSNDCPKSKWIECMESLAVNNQFYLSFESSLCRDYITEKAFKLFLFNINMVPIVRGLPSKQLQLYLPPKTFINYLGNSTTKEKMDKIYNLATNKSEYDKFIFNRRRLVSVSNTNNRQFCQLCQKIQQHEQNKAVHARLYDDIETWFFGTGTYKLCSDSLDEDGGDIDY